MKRRAPSRLPLPNELFLAPELAVLVSLAFAADVAIVTLVAAIPELHRTSDGHDIGSSAAATNADRVIAKAQELIVAIIEYRMGRLDELRRAPATLTSPITRGS